MSGFFKYIYNTFVLLTLSKIHTFNIFMSFQMKLMNLKINTCSIWLEVNITRGS